MFFLQWLLKPNPALTNLNVYRTPTAVLELWTICSHGVGIGQGLILAMWENGKCEIWQMTLFWAVLTPFPHFSHCRQLSVTSHIQMIKTDNRTSQHRLSDKPVPLTHATEQPDKLSLLTSALVSAHELSSWVIPIAAATELTPSPYSAAPCLTFQHCKQCIWKASKGLLFNL